MEAIDEHRKTAKNKRRRREQKCDGSRISETSDDGLEEIRDAGGHENAIQSRHHKPRHGILNSEQEALPSSNLGSVVLLTQILLIAPSDPFSFGFGEASDTGK